MASKTRQRGSLAGADWRGVARELNEAYALPGRETGKRIRGLRPCVPGEAPRLGDEAEERQTELP